MDIDSFIVQVKTDDVYKNIAEDVEARFDTFLIRLLPKGKNKKSNWINERWIRWTNHGRICWIKKKNIELFIDLQTTMMEMKNQQPQKSVS